MAGLNAQGLGVTVFNLHHADARGFEGMHMYTHGLFENIAYYI